LPIKHKKSSPGHIGRRRRKHSSSVSGRSKAHKGGGAEDAHRTDDRAHNGDPSDKPVLLISQRKSSSGHIGRHRRKHSSSVSGRSKAHKGGGAGDAHRTDDRAHNGDPSDKPVPSKPPQPTSGEGDSKTRQTGIGPKGPRRRAGTLRDPGQEWSMSFGLSSDTLSTGRPPVQNPVVDVGRGPDRRPPAVPSTRGPHLPSSEASNASVDSDTATVQWDD
jgi:hypothetical protein